MTGVQSETTARFACSKIRSTKRSELWARLRLPACRLMHRDAPGAPCHPPDR